MSSTLLTIPGPTSSSSSTSTSLQSKSSSKSGGGNSNIITCEGSTHFRLRLICATLSGKTLVIKNIRATATPHNSSESGDMTGDMTGLAGDDIISGGKNHIGLLDYEASFLRLLEKITDGCVIDINETGTMLRYKPGVITGISRGKHICNSSRSIGWYLMGILPLFLFSKSESNTLSLEGITNNEVDMGIDSLIHVTLPILRAFLPNQDPELFELLSPSITVKRRGLPPLGGGLVEISVPSLPFRNQLNALNLTDEGYIKRVRGVAYSSKISPQFSNRVVAASREVLNHLLPDVFIHTDVYTGATSGLSPGYGTALHTLSTTGVVLGINIHAPHRKITDTTQPSTSSSSSFSILNDNGSDLNATSTSSTAVSAPEDIGRESAELLLEEIYRGGCIDSSHQSLVLLLMILGPEEVARVKTGPLTPYTIQSLRLYKQIFGVEFNIRPTTMNYGNKQDGNNGFDSLMEDDYEEEDDALTVEEKKDKTVLLSCLGTGFRNFSRKVA